MASIQLRRSVIIGAHAGSSGGAIGVLQFPASLQAESMPPAVASKHLALGPLGMGSLGNVTELESMVEIDDAAEALGVQGGLAMRVVDTITGLLQASWDPLNSSSRGIAVSNGWGMRQGPIIDTLLRPVP